MKNRRLKKFLTESVILIAIFLVAVQIFGYFTNKGNDNMTADMGTATYPQISFSYHGYTINTLPGYSRKMEIASLRDTITPVSDGKLEINIKPYENQITSAECRIYSLDGNDQLMKTEVENPEGVVTIQLSDSSVLAEEKVLQVILNCGEKSVYYYTRIVDEEGTQAAECLDYIKEFHENALDKVEGAGIGTAIEPSAAGDSTTLQHVTIHSDYDHVTWGELEPQEEGGESWLIKELNGTSCSVQLEFQVRCKGEENEDDLYKVKEFFRVRYDKYSKKGLLLDYDRTMDQIFDPSRKVLSSKGILLGIANPDVPYMVNSDGTKVAFVQADELWHYNKDTDEVSLVFGFSSSENKDDRNNIAQHKIEILEMDKPGNVTFAVYGYMNRGAHEGDVGVAVYFYNTEQNSVEERAFLTTNKSYGHAVCELGKMVYYSNDRNMLYAIIDGTFYEIDVEKSRIKELATGLDDGQYVVSNNKKKIAYQMETKEGEVQGIKIMNLSTGSERSLECEEGEILTPLGFMRGDFVYGVARESDQGELLSGEKVYPMCKIEIQNSKGEVVKTYENEGIYILDTEFQDNMIVLSRATKKGTTYHSTAEDYITNNEEKEESNISLESYVTSLKQRQMRLVYQDGIEDTEPKHLKPKQVLDGKPKTFSFDEKQKSGEQYLVYGYGELKGIYDRAGEAVVQADAYNGVVVTSKQAYVWERGNRDLQYTITEKDALIVSMRERLKNGEAPVDVVKQLQERESFDLTGCTVEELMYIINQGQPVIAMTDAKTAVILVGYTESTVTYVDVTSGEQSTVSVEEMGNMTKKSGHTYIA